MEKSELPNVNGSTWKANPENREFNARSLQEVLKWWIDSAMKCKDREFIIQISDIESLEPVGRWVALGCYGISSLVFLHKGFKYYSKQNQEILFSEINLIWAAHFYIMSEASLTDGIIFLPLIFSATSFICFSV